MLFVIFAAGVITIKIYDTAKATVEQIKTDFGAVFKLKRAENPSSDRYYFLVSREEYEKVAGSEYVRELKLFRYIHEIPYGVRQIHTGFGENSDMVLQTEDTGGFYINDSEYFSLSENPFYERKSLYIIGYNTNITDLPERTGSPLELYRGEMIKNDGECVVTQSFYNDFYNKDEPFFANRNVEINIGDKLTIVYKFFFLDENELEKTGYTEKTFTIVGICRDTQEEILYPDSKIIYTTMEGAHYFWRNDEYRQNNPSITKGFDALYYLHTYEDGEKFMREVNEKMLYGDLTVEYNQGGFSVLTDPLKKIQDACMIFLCILAGVGIFAIIIMTSMSLNERKYDIGVLYSMGMSKQKIIFSLVFETLAFIACITVLSLICGFCVSGMPYFSKITGINGFEPDAARIALETGTKIMLAGLGVSVISAMISCVFILKHQFTSFLKK